MVAHACQALLSILWFETATDATNRQIVLYITGHCFEGSPLDAMDEGLLGIFGSLGDNSVTKRTNVFICEQLLVQEEVVASVLEKEDQALADRS